MGGREYLHWMLKTSAVSLAAETECCPDPRGSPRGPVMCFLLWASPSSVWLQSLSTSQALSTHSETQTLKNAPAYLQILAECPRCQERARFWMHPRVLLLHVRAQPLPPFQV